MNKSETISNLAAALCKAQAELKNPSLDSVNPHFKSKFASLANIRNTITAVFTKHGLSMMQNITSTERAVGCSTMLLHDSGEWMESDTIWVPVEKANAQGFGSAATYARRYSESAFTNTVGDDDDDGNAASEPVKKVSPVRPNSAGEDFWNNAEGDEKDFLNGELSVIRDFLAADIPADAADRFYAIGSIEEQGAVWSQLGSKERAQIKQYKPNQPVKEAA